MPTHKNNIKNKNKKSKKSYNPKNSKYQRGGAAAAASSASDSEYNNSATVKAIRNGPPNEPINISKLLNQKVDRLPNGIFSKLDHIIFTYCLNEKIPYGITLLLLRFYLQELLPKGKSAIKYLTTFKHFTADDLQKDFFINKFEGEVHQLFNEDNNGLNQDKRIETACWFQLIPESGVKLRVDYINLGESETEQTLFSRFKDNYLFEGTDDRLKKEFLRQSKKYKMIYKIKGQILFEVIVEKYRYLGVNAIKFNLNIPEDNQDTEEEKTRILFEFFLNRDIYKKYKPVFNKYIERGGPTFLSYLVETYPDLFKEFSRLEADDSFANSEAGILTTI